MFYSVSPTTFHQQESDTTDAPEKMTVLKLNVLLETFLGPIGYFYSLSGATRDEINKRDVINIPLGTIRITGSLCH